MKPDNQKTPDYILLLTVLALLGIGVVIVFSSSAVTSYAEYGDSYYFLKRQLIWGIVGLVSMLVVMNIDYHRFQDWAPAVLLVSVVSLLIVLIPGVGVMAGGSRRWLQLGPFGYQPSVLAKLALVIYAARYLAKKKERVQTFFRGLFWPLLLSGLIFYLILLQPDLGTGLAIVGAVFLMIFAAGARLSHLFLLSMMGLPVLFYMILSEPYRRARFLAFLDPWSDPLHTGYNIIQSLYALGSGGLFGLGLGRSRQKFFYLPEQYTDFIFAVLGEELGFIGSFTVLCLFFLFAWRGYRLALTAPDLFGCLISVGITSIVILQALINIGVVTGSLPITGITLPFISYGGSSLVIMLTGVGILLNISRKCP